MRAALLICLLLPLAALTSACQEHPKSTVKVELPSFPEGKKPSVSLPEPPSADGFIIPERNKDGTLRVGGLIEYQSNHLDKPVEVTAYLAHVSAACDPKIAKEKGEDCPVPFMRIKDDPNASRELLVVGYDEELIERAKLVAGETRLIKGSYKNVAQGFAVTETGLIVLEAVDEIVALSPEKAKAQAKAAAKAEKKKKK